MRFKVVRVIDIILDESHSHYLRYGKEESVGTIFWSPISRRNPVVTNLDLFQTAKPLNYSISHYPVPNEILHILGAPSSTYNENNSFDWYYMPPISIYKDPSSNAYPTDIRGDIGEGSGFYEGRYFKSNENVRPLRPYEGDIMIEGRFGQSIRFGSTINNTLTAHPNEWSNEGKVGNPITIIRNGQQGNEGYEVGNPDKETFKHILENINEDDSSIYLCSTQQISNFIPASLYKESYGVEDSGTKPQETVIMPNNEFPPSIEEKLTSYTPPIPPEEIQNTSEINPEIDPETAQYDIAPTEQQIVQPTDTDNSIPPNLIVPDNIDPNVLAAPIDNLSVSPFTISGDENTPTNIDDQITIPGYNPDLPDGGGTFYDDGEDFDGELD
tara:strand:- start:2066 stop:3217 length:1152 start_codon:yes stop_codon:yes gene_type:complete